MKKPQSKHRTYFTDFVGDKVSKKLKIGIDNPVYGFNSRLGSHRSSWPHMLAAMMRHEGFSLVEVITDKDRDWNEFDSIVIDWGMEFKGIFNVFGGASDDLADSLDRMLNFKGSLFSAHIEPPSLADFIEAREHTGTEKFKALAKYSDDFRTIQNRMYSFENIYQSSEIVFGDSHALSLYKPGMMMYRHDGQTLHGILEKGLSNVVPKHADHMVFYFGNIDVRHHLLRHGKNALPDLLSKMEEELVLWSTGKPYKTVELTYLLPVEHEGRKLPKTGYYEGTPFYGSREDRAKLVHRFNKTLDRFSLVHGWSVNRWPREWYDIHPEAFAETWMERPRSVHLGRHGYFFDLETNKWNESTHGPLSIGK